MNDLELISFVFDVLIKAHYLTWGCSSLCLGWLLGDMFYGDSK